MNNKQKYKQLCAVENSIPVFSKDWWLDAVCGKENWDVVLIEKNGKIVASLPYYIKNKFGFKIITMPQLTQTMGVWIKYSPRQKYEKKLSYEKKIFTEIIAKLPKVAYFSQNFHYSITNWLPFYWRGFKQTTRYTYVIEDLSDLDRVYNNFSHAKKKNIKKASNIVNVKFDLPADQFYANHRMTLSKQGGRILYSFEFFKDIYSAAYQNNSGKTIYAVDEKDNVHAALFIVWDGTSAYNLISTIDPDFRNSGAASLLVNKIIKYVADKTTKFDFEGSMIENVENSFRQFGAIQKPYFNISKSSNMLIKICQAVTEVLR
ncbi:GNAT family N-acetyltransferase [Dehalococcoidia bacterium]|nr:GNAT family N-acetyltransferase [Dehalococcoidia bacterium]